MSVPANPVETTSAQAWRSTLVSVLSFLPVMLLWHSGGRVPVLSIYGQRDRKNPAPKRWKKAGDSPDRHCLLLCSSYEAEMKMIYSKCTLMCGDKRTCIDPLGLQKAQIVQSFACTLLGIISFFFFYYINRIYICIAPLDLILCSKILFREKHESKGNLFWLHHKVAFGIKVAF